MVLSSLIHLFERETATQMLLVSLVALLVLFFIIERIKKMNSKYPPGPMGLPFVGSLPFLGAEPHKAMLKLSKKYGNIFSMYLGTKYAVVLNDFDSMKEGLGHAAALYRPNGLFAHVVGGFGIGEFNGPQWKEQRRFCMRSMKDLGLGRGSWECFMHDEISYFVKQVEALQGEPTDISTLLHSSIINNVISLLIGRKLDLQKEKHITKLFSEFPDLAFKTAGPSALSVLFPGFRKFMEFFKLAGYEAAPLVGKEINRFLKKEIHQLKSSKEARQTKNFINKYLDEMEEKHKAQAKQSYDFNEAHLVGNLNVLFLGSTDGIFISLTYIFRLLAAHPDVQKRIHQELDSVLGFDRRATYEERRETPYTFATILEMERYATIVPLSTTRVVYEDFELGGYIIPKGTQIFGNIWAIQNDPKYWRQPEKFLPERFLTEDGSALLPKLPKGFAIFSLGKRNCPGEMVALMAIYLYLCSVLQKFIISPPPDEELNFRVTNGLVIQLEPQKLCFTLREP